MDPIFTIEIEGDEEEAERLRRILRGIHGPRMRDAMENVSGFIANEVVERAPRWRGDLQLSIKDEIVTTETAEGPEVTGVAFSDLDYAALQERGTPPFWPGGTKIDEWADDHGVSADAVRLAIASRGIRALHFFQHALEENQDYIFDVIGWAVAEIIESETIGPFGGEAVLGP